MAKLLDLTVYGPGHIANDLSVDSSVYAKAFVTSGGTNAQIVRGDGTLANISGLSVNYAASAGNADTVDNFHVNTSSTGKNFGKIPVIGADGVTEVGRYIDFHFDNTTSLDYSTRLHTTGNHGNSVSLPSATGVLALTSEIPTKVSQLTNDSGYVTGGPYLPLSGGTMTLGEGLKFHYNENYFGTNLDARIISLLDSNDVICDGGLIIDERATLNGTEHITELLRIRHDEFKWRENTIWHAGNDGAESGLDADLLDGYNEWSFLRYRDYTTTSGTSTLWNQIGIRSYHNALPEGLSGLYNYGQAISFPGNGSRLDIFTNHTGSTDTVNQGLWWRSGWNDDKREWRRIIDSGNIGSQSVSYASSAGSAGSAGYTTRLYANSTTNFTTYPGDYSLAYSRFQSDVTGIFPVSNNANGVITAHLHAGNYYTQIGLSSDGRMYYRTMMSQALDAGVSWNKVAFVTDITSHYWANIRVSTSSSDTTTPMFGHAYIKGGNDSGLNLYTTASYTRIRFYNSSNENNATIHYFGTAYSGSGEYVKDSLNLGATGLITLGGWNNPTMVVSNNTTSSNSNGNVGIGITSPSYKLHVRNSSTNFSIPVALTENTATGTSWYAVHAFTNPNMSTGEYAAIQIGKVLNEKNCGHLSFYYAGNASNNNRFALGFYNVIDLIVAKANGNVGIGTASPNHKLHVNGDVYTSSAFMTDKGRLIANTASNNGFIVQNGTGVNIAEIGYYNDHAYYCNYYGSTENAGIEFYDNGNTAIFNKSAERVFRVLNSGHSLVGKGTKELSTSWKPGLIVGPDGTDKIVATYLASSTNGATLGAHNSALTAWAPLHLIGTKIHFRINESLKMEMNSTVLDASLGASFSGSGYFGGNLSSSSTGASSPSDAGLEVREYARAGTATGTAPHTIMYAPRIGFHWGSRYWANLAYFDSAFRFVNHTGASYVNIYCANMYGTASNVTVSNNDTAGTYNMVFHSTSTLYSTSGIYCNPSTDALYSIKGLVNISEADANKYAGTEYYNLAVGGKASSKGASILLWRADDKTQQCIVWSTGSGDHAGISVHAGSNDFKLWNNKGGLEYDASSHTFKSGVILQTVNNDWLSPARVQIGRTSTNVYTDRSCVGTTDGNLHLDAYKGKQMYLNYYSSAGNIYFNGGTYYINGGYYNGTSAYATQLTYKDFTFTTGTTVADYAKATTCGYNAGTIFSTSGWAWASSSNLDVGGHTVDRMRYSAFVYRNGNLNSTWQQHAVMFIPTYSDSNMIYLAQMTTTDQLTVSTSVKRYLDYDTTYSNIYNAAYNALVNGYASSAGNADTVDSLHASAFMRASSDGSYYGLQDPAGSTANWIRTTTNGIIPATSGGASSLGTSSWPFSTVYGNNFYGYFNGNLSGTANRANYLSGHGVNPDNSHPGHGARVFYSWNIGQAGNSSSGYSNGITIGSHPSDTAYGFQIVQNMWDDTLYVRRYNGGWQSWRAVSYTDHGHRITRLHRRDDSSDYSLQHHWTGSYWYLRGYSGDSYHAGVQVAYADNSGYASSAGNADTLDGYHHGSFAKSENGVYPVRQFTKSLAPTTSWSDTGITTNDFADGEGAYMLFLNPNHSNGSDGWVPRYAGIFVNMSGTNGSETEEIILQAASHASYKRLFLRFINTANTLGYRKLQIRASSNYTASYSMIFKIRRII